MYNCYNIYIYEHITFSYIPELASEVPWTADLNVDTLFNFFFVGLFVYCFSFIIVKIFMNKM